MVSNVLQLIIVALLAFVLMFGLSFILNMLLKTTWVPVALYTLVILGLLVYFGQGITQAWESVGEYGMVDWLAIACGFVGTCGGGWTIQMLRKNGYRMF